MEGISNNNNINLKLPFLLTLGRVTEHDEFKFLKKNLRSHDILL